jgi:nucleoside-diphosphate-sugar epimerase
MDQNIIITGATGLVGRNLIPQIVKVFPKESILSLTKNQDTEIESRGRLFLKKFGISTKNVDLATGYGLRDLPKNPKLIIHLAAETDTSKKDHSVNDVGIKNLYKAFRKLGPKTHFIYIGTMVAVVGRNSCKNPIDENSEDFPTNEYTRTKVVGEQYLIDKCKGDKFQLTILRPNTIYGKNVRRNSLFDMVKSMIVKKSIITRINWPGKSSLIHVEDVVKTILFFSKRNAQPGVPEKYLLCAENLSISDISKILHKNLHIKYRPINFPKWFWQIASKFRPLIPYFEKPLGTNLYNYLWRSSIIIDDVVWCKTNKINKVFKKWKPILFAEKGYKDII